MFTFNKTFSFSSKTWQNEKTVFVTANLCQEMAGREWPFWKSNSLILLNHTKDHTTDLQLNLNSRIYYLDTNFSLFEMFKYQPSNLLHTEQIIGNTLSDGFVPSTQFIWNRRSNLSSVYLGVIYGGYPPIVWKENNTGLIKGMYAVIFSALQEKLQFKYTLHHQEDGVWGNLQTNGSFNGMFGKIQSGKINLSIADTTITIGRSQFFDFSLPIISQHKKLITRKPTENFDYSSYLSVFSVPFWTTLAISALLLVLFMFGILSINSDHQKQKSYCLVRAFTFVTLSLFGREIFWLNTKWSGKILHLVIVIWGFLVAVSYNAILTSVLVSSTAVQSIDSLEDLLSSTDYTLILKADGSTRDHFANALENTIGTLTHLGQIGLDQFSVAGKHQQSLKLS